MITIYKYMRTHFALPLITIFIVTLLFLQGFAVFGMIYSKLYPFTDYPMYSQAHYNGEPIRIRYLLYGISTDSSEILIMPEDMSMSFFEFERVFGWRLIKGRDLEERLQFIRDYETEHQINFKEIRIEEEVVKITDQGVERIPNKVLKVIVMDSSKELK